MVWYNNYFCIIENITKSTDSKYDRLQVRKIFRENGARIKSVVPYYVYRCWVDTPPVTFGKAIEKYQRLIETYKKLTNDNRI